MQFSGMFYNLLMFGNSVFEPGIANI